MANLAEAKKVPTFGRIKVTKQDDPILTIESTLHFIHNFPYNFIEEIWGDETWLAKHLRSKFSGFCLKDGYGSANAIMKLINTLDQQNANKLYKYIKQYSDKRS